MRLKFNWFIIIALLPFFCTGQDISSDVGFYGSIGSKSGFEKKLISSTWSEQMRDSYISINSHSTFTQAQQDSILSRLQEDYIVTTFGPDGQDKTVCDFFLFFENSNTSTPLATRIINKSGDVLRWNYGFGGDSIFTQNNLPAHVNNGVITVTSTDGFASISRIELFGNTFINNLPYFGYCTGMNYFNADNNQFTGNAPSFENTILSNYMGVVANQFTGNAPKINPDLALASGYYIYNNEFSGNTPNESSGISPYQQLYGNDFTVNNTTVFIKNLVAYNLSSNNLPTSEVDGLLSNMDDWFVGGNLMTANCTVTLNGTGMGIPTDDSSNADIVSLLAKATGQGKTWTFIINE